MLKRFFKKKKAELSMGPGRKLNAEPTSSSSSSSKQRKHDDVYVPPKRKGNELSSEARAAAAAALTRIEQKSTSKDFNTSIAAIKAQVKREMDAEKKAKQDAEHKISDAPSKPDVAEVMSSKLAVQGVYFRCPMINDEVLPKKEWRIKIKEFLYEQLTEERGLTACLIIINCNTKDKSEPCVETLKKYLENITLNPDEEKYRKIRMSNRIFAEKVQPVEGALDFLLAAGFLEKVIDNEPFLVWSLENIDNIEHLNMLLDGLSCAETISLDLDRNIQVLLSSQARRVALPPDFYRISPEEMKREQELRSNAIEQAQILKTKAMREREELRVANRYRYALIRVRFPNGIYLQGTFNTYEKLSEVYDFVQSCLTDEKMDFVLIAPTGVRFSDDEMDKSLFDLRLIPNTIFNFEPTEGKRDDGEYIKQELLMLIQQI